MSSCCQEELHHWKSWPRPRIIPPDHLTGKLRASRDSHPLKENLHPNLPTRTTTSTATLSRGRPGPQVRHAWVSARLNVTMVNNLTVCPFGFFCFDYFMMHCRSSNPAPYTASSSTPQRWGSQRCGPRGNGWQCEQREVDEERLQEAFYKEVDFYWSAYKETSLRNM